MHRSARETARCRPAYSVKRSTTLTSAGGAMPIQSTSQVIVVPPPRAARSLEEVKAERNEMTGVLDALRREHRDLRVELSRMPDVPERKIRSERLGELDERIQVVEKQLDVNLSEMSVAVPQGTTTIE